MLILIYIILPQKPSNCNAFLKDFVIEAKYLISNGITLNNKMYQIAIDGICCDSPAVF